MTGLSPEREAEIPAGQHPREAVILNALYCEVDSEAAERAEQALSEIIQELVEVRQERDLWRERAESAAEERDALAARLDAMTEALRTLTDACTNAHSGMPGGGWWLRGPTRQDVEVALAALASPEQEPTPPCPECRCDPVDDLHSAECSIGRAASPEQEPKT